MSKETVKKYKWWVARDLLEVAIVLSLIGVLSVIYIPRQIWDEEELIKSQSQFNIEHSYDILSYYNRITGERTINGDWAIRLVNAARDSITADSNFIGDQEIILDGKITKVDLFENFSTVYDTSFGFLKTRKDTIQDTIMTVILFNEEEFVNDTSYVRKDMLNPYLIDSTFVGISDTSYSSHVEVVSYYDNFTPNNDLLICPLTSNRYLITLTDEDYKVESPIIGNYKERRYLIFSFNSKSHGKIEDGDKSWARF